MSLAAFWEFARWAVGLLAVDAAAGFGLRFGPGWLLARAGRPGPGA